MFQPQHIHLCDMQQHIISFHVITSRIDYCISRSYVNVTTKLKSTLNWWDNPTEISMPRWKCKHTRALELNEPGRTSKTNCICRQSAWHLFCACTASISVRNCNFSIRRPHTHINATKNRHDREWKRSGFIEKYMNEATTKSSLKKNTQQKTDLVAVFFNLKEENVNIFGDYATPPVARHVPSKL